MSIEAPVSAKIPARCRKCPVLQRYNHLIATHSESFERHARVAFFLLSRAELAPFAWDSDQYQRDAWEFRQGAESAAVYKDKAEHGRDVIVARMAEDPYGANHGSSAWGLFKVLEVMRGSRVCHNPAFAELYDDREIGLQLDLGGWQATPEVAAALGTQEELL